MGMQIHTGLVWMPDSIDELEKKIPLLSPEEKKELKAQVQRLLDVIMRDVRGSAQHLEGHSSRYREAWSLITERRRLMIRDLERIGAMLE
jgi:hypothetical protein